MRANWDARLVENARVEMLGTLEAICLVRNDMIDDRLWVAGEKELGAVRCAVSALECKWRQGTRETQVMRLPCRVTGEGRRKFKLWYGINCSVCETATYLQDTRFLMERDSSLSLDRGIIQSDRFYSDKPS